jgi:cobalt/nickel transport system permease protein
MSLLLAVHLSDGVLAWPWLVAGFGALPCFLWWGLRGLREEEIPRIALLSAAFFVATLIHIPTPPVSTHMLLNGLVGILLGRRAAVAIPLGLLLQATLFGHGGLTALGVNTAIMLLPALLVASLFRWCKCNDRFAHARFRWIMGCGLGVCGVLGTSVLFFLTLLFGSEEDLSWLAMVAFVLHLPIMIIEGFLTGVTINFLYRVKPSMLCISSE